MKVKSGKNGNAMWCGSDYGPTFGRVHNYGVGFYTDTNLKDGYTNLNNTYELPSGASETFLTGKHGSDNRFEATEVEVFKV